MKKSLLYITLHDVHSSHLSYEEELMYTVLKRLTHWYDITIISPAYHKGPKNEMIDEIRHIRLRSKRSVTIFRLEVFAYYRKYIANKQHFDLVVEQFNMLPLLYSLYAGGSNTLLFIHHLSLTKSWITHFILSLSLLFLHDKHVITVSRGTKTELVAYGFKSENIHIISEGISLDPLFNLNSKQKFSTFTILSLMPIGNEKQALDQIEIFIQAKRYIPELQMKLAGYCKDVNREKIVRLIQSHPLKKDIQYAQEVTFQQKLELLQRSHIIIDTSVKGAWGPYIIEAASQGTPAVVYDLDGLRERVEDGKTGTICKKNTTKQMASEIYNLYKNPHIYTQMRRNGWYKTKFTNFDIVSMDFNQTITNRIKSINAIKYPVY